MEYLNLMRDLGWNENGFVGKTIAFHKFFEFSHLMGWKTLDPELIPISHMQHKIPKVITEENYQKVLSAIPEEPNERMKWGRYDIQSVRNRAIINLLWDTGARNSEICSLNISDLQLSEHKAVIHTEKSRGRRPFREIFWTESTNDDIIRWLAARKKLTIKDNDSDALFISVASQHFGYRLNKRGVAWLLQKYSHMVGLPTQNAHSFRHHMGRDIINKGGTNSDVMNILGHSSMQSSMIYTMLENKELAERYHRFKGS